jgi:hypothetical protein
MHTLVDFLTRVKGIEYILSILFIAGFMILWEMLKAKPFRTLATTGREDLSYIREAGVLKTVGRIVAAPFIGLFYIITLPIGFAAALVMAVVTGIYRLAGKSATFGWRPAEAYLAGKKKTVKPDVKKAADKQEKTE